MLTKRSTIVLLVGLNLFLLAALLIGSYSLPAARAQSSAQASDFVCVTADAAGQEYDVLYVLDLPAPSFMRSTRPVAARTSWWQPHRAILRETSAVSERPDASMFG